LEEPRFTSLLLERNCCTPAEKLGKKKRREEKIILPIMIKEKTPLVGVLFFDIQKPLNL